MGVDNRAANDWETALPEVTRQRIRFCRYRRNLVHPLPSILDRAVTDEAPYVIAESTSNSCCTSRNARALLTAAMTFRRFRMIPDRRAADAILRSLKRAHFFRIELRKCLAVRGAFVENGGPGQSGLRSLEDQEFKLGAIVADRHPPLFVMIGKIQIIAATHPAATLTLIFVVHVPPRRKRNKKRPAAFVLRAPSLLTPNGSQRSDGSAALAFTAFALAFGFIATRRTCLRLRLPCHRRTCLRRICLRLRPWRLSCHRPHLPSPHFYLRQRRRPAATGKCRHRKRGRVGAGRGNHQRACQSTSNSNGNRLQHVFLRHRPHSSLELALPGLVNFWRCARSLNQNSSPRSGQSARSAVRSLTPRGQPRQYCHRQPVI